MEDYIQLFNRAHALYIQATDVDYFSFEPYMDQLNPWMSRLDIGLSGLNDAFFMGDCGRPEGTVLDFLLDLAHSECRSTKAIEIAKVAIDHFPECFEAHETYVHAIVYSDNTQWVEAAERAIELGKQQGKRTGSLQFFMGRRKRPAKNQQHAAQIAYYELFPSERAKYPRSYISGRYFGNDTYGVDIGMGSGVELPKDWEYDVDGFKVPIHYDSEMPQLL